MGKLQLHRAGVLVTEMVLAPMLFDATKPWLERAMNGQLYSGQLVDDSRSTDMSYS